MFDRRMKFAHLFVLPGCEPMSILEPNGRELMFVFQRSDQYLGGIMGLLFRLLSAVASAKSARTSLMNAQETAQKVHSTFRDIQSSRLSDLGTKAAQGDPRAQYEVGE